MSSRGIDLSKGGRTKQSFSDECNIENIMSRWAVSGEFSHINRAEGRYGDFTNVTDYQTALQAVESANLMFAELPAVIRSKMANNPANLVDYLSDPANHDELMQLGLLLPVQGGESTPTADQAVPETGKNEGGESTPKPDPT